MSLWCSMSLFSTSYLNCPQGSREWLLASDTHLLWWNFCQGSRLNEECCYVVELIQSSCNQKLSCDCCRDFTITEKCPRIYNSPYIFGLDQQWRDWSENTALWHSLYPVLYLPPAGPGQRLGRNMVIDERLSTNSENSKMTKTKQTFIDVKDVPVLALINISFCGCGISQDIKMLQHCFLTCHVQDGGILKNKLHNTRHEEIMRILWTSIPVVSEVRVLLWMKLGHFFVHNSTQFFSPFRLPLSSNFQD